MKYVVFDFGSVLRVKSAERERILKELTDDLNTELEKVGSETRVEGPSKLKKTIKTKDWKQTVSLGKTERNAALRSRFDELGIKDEEFIVEFIEKFNHAGKVVLTEMRSLLKELGKREDVELGILSNHALELREWLQEDFLDLVPRLIPEENVVISAEVGCKKPQKEVYEVLLETLTKSMKSSAERKSSRKNRTKSISAYIRRSQSVAKKVFNDTLASAFSVATLETKKRNKNGKKEREKLGNIEESESETEGLSGASPAHENEEALEVHPRDVLFIDNKEENIVAADDMGFATFLYTFDHSILPKENIHPMRAQILNFLEI